MKKLPAVIAALVTSALILGTILVVGMNSYIKSVQAASPSGNQTAVATGNTSAEVQQLRDLVAQYQSREQQFRDLLQQSQDSASQAQSQLQQYENLFVQLQQMGVIRVDNSGQVSVSRFGSEREFD